MSDKSELAVILAELVKGSGRWKRTQCAFCELRGMGPDHRRGGNWCLNTDRGYYHCFRCGVKGFLPGHSPDDLYERDEELNARYIGGAPEGFQLLASSCPDLRGARRYVLRRNITRDIATRARLGACLSGPLKGRIVVPILAADRVAWEGYSARLYVDTFGPKYRYPEGMERRRLLYNPAALQRETDEPCLVVEGVFDALPYYPDAVALLGKPTDLQLPLLLDSKRPLAICLDGDAWLEGEMLAKRLQWLGFPRVSSVKLPPKTDPNSLDPQWLKEKARAVF